jgi:hypothetical protein
LASVNQIVGMFKTYVNVSLKIVMHKPRKSVSYASHEDMKGQSGAVPLAEDFAVDFKSNKQKVNTRCSTKTEVTVVDDALPTVQWTTNFMADQGYDLGTLVKEIEVHYC